MNTKHKKTPNIEIELLFVKIIKIFTKDFFWIFLSPKWVQPYFHLKTCYIVTNYKYIPDKALTNRPGNHKQRYAFRNFSGFKEWQKSNSGSDTTKIFIVKVPFTLHMLVGLMNNRTAAKKNNWLGMYLQS